MASNTFGWTGRAVAWTAAAALSLTCPAASGQTHIPPHDPGDSGDALAGHDETRMALFLALAAVVAVVLWLAGRAFLENRSQRLAEENATRGVDEGGPPPG